MVIRLARACALACAFALASLPSFAQYSGNLPFASSAGKIPTCSGAQFVKGPGTCATPTGSGNVSGPGTSTNNFVPQWSGASGTLLATGLPVGTTGSNTIVKSGAGGTIDTTLLPAPSASTLGGIESFSAQSSKWINAISTSGVPSATQPACGDLSNSGSGCTTAVGTMATQSANAVAITGGTITGMPTPVAAGDVVPKSYADATSGGAFWHAPVKFASAAALPNSPTYNNGAGTLTANANNVALVIDGQTDNTLNDRLLVQNQASAFQNGIYSITQIADGTHPWVLTRTSDFNTAALGNIATGATVTTSSNGTTFAMGSEFFMNTTGTITVGVTALNWVQIVTSNITASAPLSATNNNVAFQNIPATSVPANTTGGSATPSGSVAYGTSGANVLLQVGGAGTIAAAVLPNPSASTLGGTESYAAVSNQWIDSISTAGVPHSSQPAFSNLSGSITAGQMLALPSGQIYVGNGSNVPAAVNMTGACSINSSGVITCAGSTPLTPTSKTANYTLAVSDATLWLCAAGPTSAVSFTMPNPGTAPGNTYQFSDCSGYGYTLTTVAGTALLTGGFASGAAAIEVLPPNSVVTCADGTTSYLCQVVAPTGLPNAFYVSASGSDSNAGTFTAPFLTLGKCQTAMQASQTKTCYVRAGAYGVTAVSGTPIISLGYADTGETWSYYPPDGYWSAVITESGGNAPLFSFGPGADNVTLTGLAFAGNPAAGALVGTTCGGSSGSSFVSVPGSGIIQNTAVTHNKITNVDCGIALGEMYNPVASFNYINGAVSYVGIGCWHCQGVPQQTVWEGNTVANITVGAAANTNGYGITFSNSAAGSSSNFTVRNNKCFYSATWECYDNHSGRSIDWIGNLSVAAAAPLTAAINVPALTAGSSPTGFSIPSVDNVISGNIVDVGGITTHHGVYVMCGNGAGCAGGVDIIGGTVTNNIGLMGASGFGTVDAGVTASGNSLTLASEQVSDITLSASSYTSNQPNAVVATINVGMSAAYWSFPAVPGPGTLSIGGANAAGFVICNLNQICQGASGSPAGAHSDFSITATLTGMTGSPFVKASGTLTLTGN